MPFCQLAMDNIYGVNVSSQSKVLTYNLDKI